jgi:DNA-binding PadR family transcriptional regulator
MTNEEQHEYAQLVLQVISRFSPICSDYQLWRALYGTPLDMKYPNALYGVLGKLQSDGLVEATTDPAFPHRVYSLTESGRHFTTQLQNRAC